MRLNLVWSVVAWSTLMALFILTHWTRVSALDWMPTDQAIGRRLKNNGGDGELREALLKG